jgi:SWI/SNF-related matrix-associated actin-dependent regulator of chromatin subfamily A member 5
MILVPKSTLNNWCNEIKKWCPSFKVLLLQGTKEERQEICKTKLLSGGDDWEILVTSFEVCLLEKASLRKIMWQYICIDEAHRIKNENSLLSQIMRTIQCRNRLLLTGTP